MYDDTCRFLAENFSADFASWLLGEGYPAPSGSSINESATVVPVACYAVLTQCMKSLFTPLPTPYSLLPSLSIACLIATAPINTAIVNAAPSLYLSYPPTDHQTTADRIFLIGTAPPGGSVLVNGTAIVRNTAGHFAPSLPLHMGANRFDLRYGKQTITRTVTRLARTAPSPLGLAFGNDSLSPAVDMARLPNELLCFSAIAPAKATVAVKLADQILPLLLRQPSIELPDNAAALTQQNQPAIATAQTTGRFDGCTRTVLLGDLGKPEWQLSQDGQTVKQSGFGSIKILSPTHLETATVTAASGTARTGASTEYARLTPLPKGTQALVTGYEGDWVRLDYGAWIKRSEVQIAPTGAPPTSLIRSVTSRQAGDWTEVLFPLQVPVPVSIQQGDRTFILTLYNTTAQTDIIRLSDDPLIERLDWQQSAPGQIQYTFNLKAKQQWGYKLRYEGTTLILSLKHPPTAGSRESGVGSRALAVSGQRSAVSGQRSAVSGQRSAVSGQRSAVSGQRSAVSGQRSAVSGQRSAVSGQRSAVSGQRSAVSGQRSAVSGQRSAVSGQKAIMPPSSPASPSSPSSPTSPAAPSSLTSPTSPTSPRPLSGTKILLDPGHGGAEDLGSRGPTGYPEKTVTLLMAKLVRSQLQQRGATVYLTRETDVDVPLQARVAMIDKLEPTLALSLHYNALPDDGDAMKTNGLAAFWYNTQAQSLALFLHNYLTKTLKRSSYGMFWDNLALTRPTTTPCVLLELGFMINPDEFEWITNPNEQKRLAAAIAAGITAWLQKSEQ